MKVKINNMNNIKMYTLNKLKYIMTIFRIYKDN